MYLKTPSIPLATERIQGRLLSLAALFLGVNALVLTFSDAVRAHSWAVDYRRAHWIGVLIWLGVFAAAHIQSKRRLVEHDPFLLPLAGLLSGWGILTIWRLAPGFGLRQSLWLAAAGGLLVVGMWLSADLRFLRRFKYLWLTGGLLLTALTFLFGVNPMGYGPRMWLGCCGIYLQPSEPLKLMLIAYLAAYLADRSPYLPLVLAATTPRQGQMRRWFSGLPGSALPLLSLLAPTLVLAGLAMALLVMQHDLGTASIFLFLYAVIVYLASQRKRFLLAAVVAIGLAGAAGYGLFDVVRLRVDAWLNPWLDPSGRSFQIVQSLLAVANGGFWGRGMGMGSPGLIPVVHSDMIYAAIAEEHGLLGSLGLLFLLALFASRGLRIALRASDAYRRYLAAGLTAYLIGQSLLIIGGTLRLAPLTGITLPFVSYGGSSLVTSFLSLLLLLQISVYDEKAPAALSAPHVYQQLGAFLIAGLAAAALATGWWAMVRGPDLLTRTDNPRRALSDRAVRRGALLDRRDQPINISIGEPGSYVRQAAYPDLSNIIGYTDPVYGQSGLEASLDTYLRGIEGNSGLLIWWNHLLYGEPPPGLDVRLSLDLEYQYTADQLLHGRRGALVMLQAENGEILTLASHPTFDANNLERDWERLVRDPAAPLLDRASSGKYPPGEWQTGLFAPAFAAPGGLTAPQIRLPAVASRSVFVDTSGVSPLQMALLAAAVGRQGIQPAPLLATAVNLPDSGWVLLPALDEPRRMLSAQEAGRILRGSGVPEKNLWQSVQMVALPDERAITWYIGGTLPEWKGAPVALALLLEEDNPALAEQIGQVMLDLILRP